jgi:iron complex outermembrane receptor protein
MNHGRSQKWLILVSLWSVLGVLPAGAEERSPLAPLSKWETEPLSEAPFFKGGGGDPIPHLRDQAQPATTVKEWRAQIEAATVQIANISLTRTETGLDITLETTKGKPLQVDATKFRREGNSLIADIPNAVLALPQGQAFTAENPTADIATVQVVQQEGSIRVSVTGTTEVPTVKVSPGTSGLVLSLSTPSATAQTPSPENPAPQPEEDIEIVVTGQQDDDYFVPNSSTATRTDTPILDTPASIQVIPKQVLEDQQVIRLEEALRNATGVATSTNEGLGANIEIRGFTGAPLLVDGFRQYEDGVQALPETANLERIEVLRGPASILYGEIQPGGVVNLVTKRPLSEPFYAAELQVGSRTLVRPRIDFSGPLTADGNLLYRLNALVSTQEPFRDHNTNFRQVLVAPSLTWKISDRTDLTLNLDYSYNEQPSDYGRVASGDRVLRTPRDFITGEPDDNTETSILNVGYEFEHRFSDNWKLRNAFRYISTNRFLEFTFPSSFDPTTGIITRNFGGGDFKTDSYSLQTYGIGKFATGPVQHELLFGVDLNHTRRTEFGSLDFDNPLLLDISNPVYGATSRPNFRNVPPFVDQQVTQNRLGIYLQDRIDLLDNLSLLAGVRYDTVNQTTRSNPTAFDPNSSEVEQNDDALTPRVGILYQPIPNLSLFASYSESFTPNVGTDFDGNVLEPERGRGWEVGIKAELIDGKLLATLTYFDITKQNVATTDPVNPFFSIATAKQRSRGVEFDLSGQILPGWNIIASYAYIDAKVTEDNAIPIGNRLAGIPEHSASLWTTYQIQNGDLQGLGFGIGFNFVGERQGDLDNTFSLDSYFLTNAAIFYRRNNWNFAVNFKNIGNVDYGSGTPIGNTRIGVGEPFTVIGSVSVKF